MSQLPISNAPARNTRKPPIPVVAIACLYLAVGIAGFTYHFHFHELLISGKDSVWVEVTESIAIVCGVFILRRRNWARWLAVAWMAFHVILSAFHSIPEFAVHSLLLAVIAWVLFASPSARIFRSATVQPG